MHDGGSLQSMFAVLAAHLTRCNPMQFAVDQLHQAIGGLTFAAPPPVEKSGDRPRIVFARVIHYSQL